MDVASRLAFIKEVGEEIVTEEDLKELLEKKDHPVAYDGFEPSGRVHIAQGLLRAININKMTKAGCAFKMYVADWFAWANNKLGGDLKRIHACGEYMIEVWKACGLDTKGVKFVWTSDVVKDHEYWKTVMEIARNTTVQRMLRCGQILGRTEGEMQQTSQVLYPVMQCADIFHLKADITQLGMDQRKVNILAREIGPKLGYWKPVVVSHHMLMGLAEPPPEATDPVERAIAMKMSKSHPDSAIFMTDPPEEVKRKIMKAYCPPKQVDENPVLDYAKHILFERFPRLDIPRPEKFGGPLSFASYKELEDAYAKGQLHPEDLKGAAADRLNELLAPVRRHFERNRKARKLLAQVQSFEVTR